MQGRQKEGWESVLSTLERVPQAHAVHRTDVTALWTIEKAGSKPQTGDHKSLTPNPAPIPSPALCRQS